MTNTAAEKALFNSTMTQFMTDQLTRKLANEVHPYLARLYGLETFIGDPVAEKPTLTFDVTRDGVSGELIAYEATVVMLSETVVSIQVEDAMTCVVVKGVGINEWTDVLVKAVASALSLGR